jgi:hypothetical protein
MTTSSHHKFVAPLDPGFQPAVILNRSYFPSVGKITLHVPNEKSRRICQAVAAASLPQSQPATS